MRVRPPPRNWEPIIISSAQAHPGQPTTTTTSSPETSLNRATPTSDDDHLAPNASSVDLADTSASTQAPTPIPPARTTNVAETPSPQSPKLTSRSRRERILDLARQNARTPLPKRLVSVEEGSQPRGGTGDEQKPEVESEQQGKERTIRERLWRLVGGNY